jgi:uncharacterized membrane protein YqjE
MKVEDIVVAHPSTRIDVDAGIPDLVRRLTDDSKRLAIDEVRLAKMELRESVRNGVHGSAWLAVSLGVGVVALVAFTVLAIAVVSAIADGNLWAGALVVGVAELLAGWLCLRQGLTRFREPSYSLAASRESLKDTAHWVRHPAMH